jgi:N-acetylglucosaminyldiphosphoundecaprenol N-acetyl-beta-D-mannosaminyltransferase
MKMSSTIKLLGIPLTLYDRAGLLTAVHNRIQTGQKTIVLSGNVHSFNLAYETEWLRDFFNRADIVRLDGAGVRLGAKLLGVDTPSRMTWADFAWDLAQFCAQNQYTLYFLGAKPGIAPKAAQKLQSQYPDLHFAGIQHGYFDKEKGSAENTAVLHQINAAQPHILVVGFGMPLQEKWLSQNLHDINVPVIMTAGAAFDYISGELQRGPAWMTNNGLEWLARLLIEPRRLWRRYIIGNPLFLWRILKQRFGLLKLNQTHS